MRYSASEKLEIIELVEQSTLSVGLDWDSKIDVLRLVRPISGRGDRGSGGRQAQTAAGLEQDP